MVAASLLINAAGVARITGVGNATVIRSREKRLGFRPALACNG